MRTLLSLLSASILLLFPPRAAAQDDARSLVEKAVKAAGGAEALARAPATRTKMKGKLAGAVTCDFTGEQWARPGALKTALHLDIAGAQLKLTQAIHAGGTWITEDGRDEAVDADTAADMRVSLHHHTVIGLLPLLDAKAFQLAAAGAGDVEGRPCVKVKASAADRPDITLFFDKETSHLLRTEFKSKKAGGKELTTAYVYGGHRPVDATADEAAVKAAGVAADGPALVAFLKGQVRSPADRARIETLVKALADESFETREQATKDLVQLGPLAVPLLRKAAAGDDTEVAKRAKECLAKIDAVKGPEGALASAVRLLALRKPDGAAAVLLDLAPTLVDETLARELRAALAEVATVGGKPDPLVEKALDDKDAARRGAAAAALGRDGGAFAKQPGRRVFVTGLTRPTKVTLYQDGAKEMEWDVVDVQFFNAFDDATFAKPR